MAHAKSFTLFGFAVSNYLRELQLPSITQIIAKIMLFTSKAILLTKYNGAVPLG
jgi:hypothetical protein